jgi:hypothetical protein
MKPIQQLRELYQKNPQTGGMLNHFMAHLETGYIFSNPEFFVMGRAIKRDAPWCDITNPWHSFPREEQDTWFIFAFAGRTSQNLLTYFPYPLTWVAWSRRNKPLRFHPFERLCHRINSLKP